MKSVLRQMYYDVDFLTHMFEPFNVEHKRIVDEANVLEKKLTDSFNKEQFEVYDKLLSLQAESSSYYSLHTFIEGFKIGAKIIMEVFSDE